MASVFTKKQSNSHKNQWKRFSSLLLILLFNFLGLSSCGEVKCFPHSAFLAACQEAKSSDQNYISSASTTPNGTPVIGMWTERPQLVVSDQFSLEEFDIISSMEELWNEATDYQIDFLDLSYGGIPLYEGQSIDQYSESMGDNIFGIYKRDLWFDQYAHDVIAITRYELHEDLLADPNRNIARLKHVDIFLNTEHYSFAHFLNSGIPSGRLPSSTLPFYDLGSVILHELGHLIGLRHLIAPQSIMQAGLSATQVNRQISAETAFAINDLYLVTPLDPAPNDPIRPNILIQGEVHFDKNSHQHHPDIQPRSTTGVIELKANGECRHFLNDKLQSVHFVKI